MNTYRPSLETKTFLNHPLEVAPIIDLSSHFIFPFALDKLPRLLAHSNSSTDKKARNLATKTITENRAFSYPPVVFKNSDTGTIYYDLFEKGGGTEIRPNVELRKINYWLDWATEQYPYIPASVDTANGKLIVRYSPDLIETLTSYLGVHDIDAGLRDKFTSEYLEQRGLRTRAFVAAWEIPPNTPMATPEGLITAEDFERKTSKKPGLELWAMRCKYRVMDILRYIFEQENENNLRDSLPLAGVTNEMWSDDQANHVYDPSRFNKKSEKQLTSSLLALANSILVRTKSDSHALFNELYDKFKVPISAVNLSDFYSAYLRNFSNVLGEQFAVMRREKVILGMFSVQNVSLLAEIVDNDTTIINGKVMDKNGNLTNPSEESLRRWKKNRKASPEEYFEQLEIGHDAIRSMLRDLSRAKILQISDEEMRTITKSFIRSYLVNTGKLNDDIVGLAQQKFRGENKAYLDSGRALDPFGKDELLCFVEDILEESHTNPL